MNAFAIRTCVAYTLFAVVFAAIPSYIKICRRKDPEINKCVIDSIEQLREKLASGIPELDVPPIEPLVLKHVRLLRGPQGASLDVNLTNIQVYGPSTFKIKSMKVTLNPNNVIFTYGAGFSKLEFRGKYQIDAKILLLKLVGDGNLTGTFFDYYFDCQMKANKVVRDNKTYISFERMKLIIKLGGAQINFDNLFGGDPILGKATNDVLNANSDLLVEEIQPALEDSLSNVFTDVSNKITETFTFDELFPDD